MDELRRSQQKIAKKIILYVVLFLTTCFLVSGIYAYYQLSRIRINKISKSDEDLGIKKNESPKILENGDAQTGRDIGIINIALFGVDVRRQKYEAAHSDSIMILSIDSVHSKIKLSSLMRDTYVNVEGHGKTKINTAYVFGGPQLAIKTLNQNFNMDIRDYYTVNFSGLTDIIDAVGGLELDIEKDEINEINKYMREIAKIKKRRPTPIKRSGLQKLNGMQAVAFARIRKVGNGDFKRTERQKEVMTELITKIQNEGAARYPFLVSKLLPNVETSMSRIDIIKLSSEIIKIGKLKIEWCRFPVDGFWKGKMINKVWYLTTDIDTTTNQLHDFLYKDINPSKKK